jgi:hypothetical protein
MCFASPALVQARHVLDYEKQADQRLHVPTHRTLRQHSTLLNVCIYSFCVNGSMVGAHADSPQAQGGPCTRRSCALGT